MTDKHMIQLRKSRAWLEIRLSALSFNAARLRSVLPEKCELMAVVKADAYGHGANSAARQLEFDGVKFFAVATLAEAVKLRKNHLNGDILIVGYTHPKEAGFLSDLRLTQLVVDGAYAGLLDESGHRIDVHIAVDTGMHRFGIDSARLDEIERVFWRKNLRVKGMATHLASSDSLLPGDVDFTKTQIDRFSKAVGELAGLGYDTGKLHVQASYGVFNYPELEFDYARAGIALYGALSHSGDVLAKPEMKPVLSMRALVAQVRDIGAGEAVSYGRTFTAAAPMKVATVSAGYADGVPRQMSGNGGQCIVHGKKVPILGRICMDLLMIDVTSVESVQAGDVVTIIGADGDEEIRCEDLAAASGTISNDILCRIGSRLPRIYC